MKDRTGQPELDLEKRAAGKECQNRTAWMGQLTGQLGQDGQDRTARAGQLRRTARTGQSNPSTYLFLNPSVSSSHINPFIYHSIKSSISPYPSHYPSTYPHYIHSRARFKNSRSFSFKSGPKRSHFTYIKNQVAHGIKVLKKMNLSSKIVLKKLQRNTQTYTVENSLVSSVSLRGTVLTCRWFVMCTEAVV
jgi:hypothetical protein